MKKHEKKDCTITARIKSEELAVLKQNNINVSHLIQRAIQNAVKKLIEKTPKQV